MAASIDSARYSALELSCWPRGPGEELTWDPSSARSRNLAGENEDDGRGSPFPFALLSTTRCCLLTLSLSLSLSLTPALSRSLPLSPALSGAPLPLGRSLASTTSSALSACLTHARTHAHAHAQTVGRLLLALPRWLGFQQRAKLTSTSVPESSSQLREQPISAGPWIGPRLKRHWLGAEARTPTLTTTGTT
jgi:hypothetical protein